LGSARHGGGCRLRGRRRLSRPELAAAYGAGVAHGSRALPFFGHSPVVAIASKRVDFVIPEEAEPCQPVWLDCL
jgi:hypothetical protein